MDWEWTKDHWQQNKEEVEKMREDGQKKGSNKKNGDRGQKKEDCK